MISTVIMVSAIIGLCSSDSIAGPYRIIPDHFERCPVELRPKKMTYHSKYFGIRDRKNVDKWYYTWNGTFNFPIDNRLTIDLNLSSWSSRGGWKENAFIFKLAGACRAFKMYAPDLWTKVMIAAFKDRSADCPFPPGSYSFRNLTTDFNMKMPPSFYYGKWRATFSVLTTKTKEVMVCIRAYGATAAKRSGNSQTSLPDNGTKVPQMVGGTD